MYSPEANAQGSLSPECEEGHGHFRGFSAEMEITEELSKRKASQEKEVDLDHQVSLIVQEALIALRILQSSPSFTQKGEVAEYFLKYFDRDSINNDSVNLEHIAHQHKIDGETLVLKDHEKEFYQIRQAISQVFPNASFILTKAGYIIQLD